MWFIYSIPLFFTNLYFSSSRICHLGQHNNLFSIFWISNIEFKKKQAINHWCPYLTLGLTQYFIFHVLNLQHRIHPPKFQGIDHCCAVSAYGKYWIGYQLERRLILVGCLFYIQDKSILHKVLQFDQYNWFLQRFILPLVFKSITVFLMWLYLKSEKTQKQW